jgi:hypothetical protein
MFIALSPVRVDFRPHDHEVALTHRGANRGDLLRYRPGDHVGRRSTNFLHRQ